MWSVLIWVLSLLQQSPSSLNWGLTLEMKDFTIVKIFLKNKKEAFVFQLYFISNYLEIFLNFLLISCLTQCFPCISTSKAKLFMPTSNGFPWTTLPNSFSDKTSLSFSLIWLTIPFNFYCTCLVFLILLEKIPQQMPALYFFI